MRNKKDSIDYHQEAIAIKTLKTHPAFVPLLGNVTIEGAKKYLTSIGYTEKELNKLNQ